MIYLSIWFIKDFIKLI